MPDVEVLVIDSGVSGLVSKGATGAEAHSAAGKAVERVVKLSSEHLIEGVTKIAQAVGPSLKAGMKGLSDISVQEISIGCTIGANGSIVIAGVGAEASLTITFKVS
jgi:hypothetical protein